MITTPRKENAIVSTNATPQTAKKPRLEATWVNENGKLICKWLSYENEDR
jgi:hypothetical protein